jgi:lauroyl-Kdo2-lipid IVA myristoyltransferase
MQRTFATRHQPRFRLGLLAPKYWLTWTLYLSAAVLWITPRALRALVARGAASLLTALPSKYRTIVQTNLRTCFPRLDEQEIRYLLQRHARIQCEVYLNYGELLFSGPERLSRRFDLLGEEHLESALEAGGRLILMMPHCCAFEFGGQALVLRHSIVSMARLHDDNDAMDWLITRLRCRFGGIVFGNDQSMVPLIKAVRDGYWMFYLPDEDRGSSQSVFVPFFGEPKLTTATIGRLAKTCRAPVLPVICRYRPETRRFELAFAPALHGPPSDDVRVDARRINQAFEDLLAPDPAQYLWTQKIFRRRPEGVPSLYKSTR